MGLDPYCEQEDGAPPLVSRVGIHTSTHWTCQLPHSVSAFLQQLIRLMLFGEKIVYLPPPPALLLTIITNQPLMGVDWGGTALQSESACELVSEHRRASSRLLLLYLG